MNDHNQQQQAFSITDTAIKHLSSLVKEQNKTAIRFGIKKSGCSGLSYLLDVTDHNTEADQIFNFSGLKVFVASQDLYAIQGTIIEFVEDGLNSHIQFKNPNSKNECGCGISFQV